MKKYLLAFSIILFCATTKGQVSFAPYQLIYTGTSANVVAIDDLNNDGLNDVAVVIGGSIDTTVDFSLLVYCQNNLGLLNSPLIYAYSTYYPESSSISSGDFNNDGLKDVVIGRGDSISIFYQNASGTLNTPLSYFSGAGGVEGVKAGDLNNDGLTDIAACHWNDNTIKVFYQLSIGGFSTFIYPKVISGFDEIEIGDLNGDSLNDLVFMRGGGAINAINVYLQNATGFLNPGTTYFSPPVFSTLSGIAIGDLNNDGRNDIAVMGDGNMPYATLNIWHQDSVTGLLQAPIDTLAFEIPEAVEIADLNCDGKNEIIVAHTIFAKVSVYEQDASGGYGSYSLFPIFSGSHCEREGLAIGDINNDNKKDVVVADRNSGLFLLLNNTPAVCGPASINENGPGIFSTISISPNPAHHDFIITVPSIVENSILEIYDLEGRKIFNKVISNKERSVNVHLNAPAGMYFIKIRAQEKVYNQKLIIQ